jgi:hypothetical protein
MHRLHKAVLPLAVFSLLTLTGLAQQEANEHSLKYVLGRYMEGMGGRANLQKISSIRMEGKLLMADGNTHTITVLKKKPDLVRIILDTGLMRLTQAYDGEVAWFSREQGRNQFIDRMEGSMRKDFLRQAPIANVLVDQRDTGAVLELAENVDVVRVPCFQVVARFPDGSRTVHFLNQETYLENRILQYNTSGDLVSEFVPSEFEMFNGVLFSKQSVRIVDGVTVSTLSITEIELNIGVLDAAFFPPRELPEN